MNRQQIAPRSRWAGEWLRRGSPTGLQDPPDTPSLTGAHEAGSVARGRSCVPLPQAGISRATDPRQDAPDTSITVVENPSKSHPTMTLTAVEVHGRAPAATTARCPLEADNPRNALSQRGGHNPRPPSLRSLMKAPPSRPTDRRPPFLPSPMTWSNVTPGSHTPVLRAKRNSLSI